MVESTTIQNFAESYSPSMQCQISFDWNGKHATDFMDSNLAFRRKVCDYFVEHKAEVSLALIADLYVAEIMFAREAWGVNRIVSVLAQEMLERGGADYLEIYSQALSCGMDAGLQSGAINISEARRYELLSCCEERYSESHGAEKNRWEYLMNRFRSLANENVQEVRSRSSHSVMAMLKSWLSKVV